MTGAVEISMCITAIKWTIDPSDVPKYYQRMGERSYLVAKESALTVLERDIEQVSAAAVAAIKCGGKHHASICDKNKRKDENLDSSIMHAHQGGKSSNLSCCNCHREWNQM